MIQIDKRTLVFSILKNLSFTEEKIEKYKEGEREKKETAYAITKEIDLNNITKNIYLCISIYSNLVSTNQKLFQSFCAWLQRVPTTSDSHWRKRKRAIRLSVDG